MNIDVLSLGNATPDLSVQPPRKLEDAARQFESLLMAELMQVSRGENSGWLGTGEDSSMSSAMDLAQEYFAQALTSQGGIGLTRYVREHLAKAGE